MELRHLEYFYTLSKTKNFTRTAEQLHVSQPSVTKALKALETELQVKLFNRSQHRVTLTEAGQVLLLHASRITHAVEEASQDMKRFRLSERPRINFGMPPMFEAYLLPDLYSHFKVENPQIDLVLCETYDSTQVRSQLETGEIDFGIVLEDPHVKEDNHLVMLESHMRLCLYPDHPLAKEESVSFDKLKDEKFIMQRPSTFQYRSIYSRCQECGFTPDIVVSASQVKAIKNMIANCEGISILPEFVLRNSAGFIQRPLQPQYVCNVSLVWPKEKVLSETEHNFISFVRRYIEKKVDSQEA